MTGNSIYDTPVVILCGGKGTRLREYTEFRPKPLVTIGGKPVLWHIMKIYATHGFKNFILCLGYKGDLIKNYFLTRYSNQYGPSKIPRISSPLSR